MDTSNHIGWQHDSDKSRMNFGKLLCRIVEILKLQRLIWSVFIVAALIGLLVTFSVFIVRTFENSSSETMQNIAQYFSHFVLMDEALANLIGNISLTVLGFALPFAFVICHQRRAVINALASAYWHNYLSHLVGSSYRIVLFQPGYINSANASFRLGEFKKALEETFSIELHDKGVECSGADGAHSTKRTALIVYKRMADGEMKELPIAIDLCRNLSVLGDIVQKEINSFLGGTICKEEYKFEFLSEAYFRAISRHLPEGNFFSNRIRSKVAIFLLHHDKDYEASFGKLIEEAMIASEQKAEKSS